MNETKTMTPNRVYLLQHKIAEWDILYFDIRIPNAQSKM